MAWVSVSGCHWSYPTSALGEDPFDGGFGSLRAWFGLVWIDSSPYAVCLQTIEFGMARHPNGRHGASTTRGTQDSGIVPLRSCRIKTSSLRRPKGLTAWSGTQSGPSCLSTSLIRLVPGDRKDLRPRSFAGASGWCGAYAIRALTALASMVVRAAASSVRSTKRDFSGENASVLRRLIPGRTDPARSGCAVLGSHRPRSVAAGGKSSLSG